MDTVDQMYHTYYLYLYNRKIRIVARSSKLDHITVIIQ